MTQTNQEKSFLRSDYSRIRGKKILVVNRLQQNKAYYKYPLGEAVYCPNSRSTFTKTCRILTP